MAMEEDKVLKEPETDGDIRDIEDLLKDVISDTDDLLDDEVSDIDDILDDRIGDIDNLLNEIEELEGQRPVMKGRKGLIRLPL